MNIITEGWSTKSVNLSKMLEGTYVERWVSLRSITYGHCFGQFGQYKKLAAVEI